MLNLPPEADPAVAAEVDSLVAEHGRDRGALLPVLQEVQRRHGEISDLAVQVVADRFGVPPVDVLGVVTFYRFLAGRRGRHVVRLCRTLSCAMAGADDIGARLERELGVPMGGTTDDGAVTVEWVHCIGQCDRAPAMLVDDDAVGDLDGDRAAETVAAVRARDRTLRDEVAVRVGPTDDQRSP
ncbi:NADH-quinone oxidoreductase subunit NuoE family protein [Cellulomonas humilata]|uniref:NADH:ubiquinone oxidoreductase subunit E n=1 Tax=Cellulomonas humilata TaxID=144055 RepID=A0ABU0EH77_9CELL|nr:NAD(P)H-dependent oxidoreductase subunit E [Cellulomonas humilata]MDQ0374611.1 NADH:ubiquinone oxidoreductase subunit E [Cellulomonas humilata]